MIKDWFNNIDTAITYNRIETNLDLMKDSSKKIYIKVLLENNYKSNFKDNILNIYKIFII